MYNCLSHSLLYPSGQVTHLTPPSPPTSTPTGTCVCPKQWRSGRMSATLRARWGEPETLWRRGSRSIPFGGTQSMWGRKWLCVMTKFYLSPKNLPIFSNLLCGTFRGRPPPREFREAQIAEIFPFVSRQAHGSGKSNSQPLMSTISTIPLNLTPNPSRQPSQPSSPLSWADDCSNCSLKTWSG